MTWWIRSSAWKPCGEYAGRKTSSPWPSPLSAFERFSRRPGRWRSGASRQCARSSLPRRPRRGSIRPPRMPPARPLGRSAGNYREALRVIAELRPAVDRFFDDVLVMAEEESARRNRLTLLAELLREFSTIADFSEMAAGEKR